MSTSLPHALPYVFAQATYRQCNPHRNRRRPSSIKKSYPIAAYSPRNFFRGVQFSCHIQPPSFPLRFHATRREASRDHIYNNQHVICTCHDTIAAIIAILDHLYVPGKVDHSIGHDNERHDHQHQKASITDILNDFAFTPRQANTFRIPFLHSDTHTIIIYLPTRSDGLIVALIVTVHA